MKTIKSIANNIKEGMESIKIGNIVEVAIEEGHELFYYQLLVEGIEVYEEEKEIVAYGVGINEEHEELAEEFTHRIDASNFVRIVNNCEYTVDSELKLIKDFEIHHLDLTIKENTIAKIKEIEADHENEINYLVSFEGLDDSIWLELYVINKYFCSTNKK